jgi:preprotein translocase subunit SecD
MNQYPVWKSVLVVIMAIFGLVYALPNVYGSDPVVQVRMKVDNPAEAAPFDSSVQDAVLKALDAAKLAHLGGQVEGNILTVRFADTETQLRAMDTVNAAIQDKGERYSAALNLISAAPEWLSALHARAMSLGLDLRGGVHFLMQVDMDSAIKHYFERLTSDFKSALVDKKIRYLSVENEGQAVAVRFRSQEDMDQALDNLQRDYPELTFDKIAGAADEFRVRVSAGPRVLLEEKKKALQQNIATLQNRINELGVAEPIIHQQGQDRIVVELPGIQDPVRARDVIGAAATLEFRLVYEGDAYEAERTGRVPAGAKLYRDNNDQPILLNKNVIVTGEQIADAASTLDGQSGQPAVSITLKGAGGNVMRRVTSENVKKPMAVVFIEDIPVTSVDAQGKTVRSLRHAERVINVATIQEEFGKRFQITGLDKPGEARDLALFLRAGSLAAPMHVAEESTVGPSLGKQNIERGVKASLLGFVLVVVGMVIYYKTLGAISCLALVMNLTILVAILSLIQATLTLPGIAGIALTLGMAIDANVLICERIREELRNGSSPHAAIFAGYDRAFATILDSNVTTIIATVLLFAIGSGPIKGFALTLTIGLCTSLFTSVTGSRAMVQWVYGNRRVKHVSV